MILSWTDFRIHLASFKNFLDENVPSSDGISASSKSFEIIEKQPLSEDETNSINTYYTSLTSEGESAKFSYESSLSVAISNFKTKIITMDWSILRESEKKVLLNRPLTSEEETYFIQIYG